MSVFEWFSQNRSSLPPPFASFVSANLYLPHSHSFFIDYRYSLLDLYTLVLVGMPSNRVIKFVLGKVLQSTFCSFERPASTDRHFLSHRALCRLHSGKNDDGFWYSCSTNGLCVRLYRVILVSPRNTTIYRAFADVMVRLSLRKLLHKFLINLSKCDPFFGMRTVPFLSDNLRQPVGLEFLKKIFVQLAAFFNSRLADALFSPNFGFVLRSLVVVFALYIAVSLDLAAYCGLVSAQHFGKFHNCFTFFKIPLDKPFLLW